MLGDGGVIDAWSEEKGDAFRGEVFHVDLVDADTVLADDLQAGKSFIDDRLGDQVVATNVSVKFPH